MNSPTISIIAAIGKNRELGKDGKIPWHISEDMKHFKVLTWNHPVIMGRKTYQSIGRPLPGRTNIIITRDKNFKAENCFVAHSLDDALDIAKQKDSQEIFIIGGGQIYETAIDIADKLYLTLVEDNFDADTFFPAYSKFTKIISKEDKQNDQYKYIFLDLEK